MSTATEDDFFNGYRIPAGSIILANHWGMCFRLQLLMCLCCGFANISYDLSDKLYGQKYDTQLFEPRRWIDRPEGVGKIDEDHPTFGFARR